jgi:hypothetical protein
VHRCDLHVLGVLGLRLEPVDFVGVFERGQWKLPEVFFQHADTAPDSSDAAEARRFDAAVHVGIEERGNIAELGSSLHRAAPWPSWIAPRLDLA